MNRIPILNRFRDIARKLNHYFVATVLMIIVVLICLPVSQRFGYYIVAFVLVLFVSAIATFMKTGPVLLISILSSVGWNFFFIPPHYTFHIEKAEDLVMFGVFFIIVFLNGIFTTRVRMHEKLAKEREINTNALFQITRELSKASGVENVKSIAIAEIKKHFLQDAQIVLQNRNNILTFSNGIFKKWKLSEGEIFQVRELYKDTLKYNKQLIFKTETVFFYPLLGTRLNPGILITNISNNFTEAKTIFRDTFLAQISNALEREFNAEQAQKANLLIESDKLYKTLFNSVSHELRIPVATIMGASEALISSSAKKIMFPDLYKEIFTASLRLNRLIGNLLNMSRLESGRITPKIDWYDVNDLINKLTEDLKDELFLFTLKIDIEEKISLIKVDFGLIEQVLHNLLINACQYTPVSSEIKLCFHSDDQNLEIQVCDRGPGFSSASLNNVFNKFYRGDDGKAGGLGLGLSIAKGFVEAHKGTIQVANRKKGGARFIIKIPMCLDELNNFTINETEIK